MSVLRPDRHEIGIPELRGASHRQSNS